MEILVINLMRLGDLVQCTPVLRQARARYPGARLTLLVMDLFQEPATLLPGVDRLLTFPSGPLAALLDQGDWPAAYRQLSEWLAKHLTPPPDLVINLTPNILAAILSFATGGREMRGLAVDRGREIHTAPAWMSYAFMVSKARQANPFNLVDLFLRGADLTPDGAGLELRIPPEAQSQADEALAALSLPEGTALVGMLPGASSPVRRWPPEKFAQAGKALLDHRDCHFLVFGSPSETPLGEAILQLLPPGTATLCLGRTSIPVLTAMLHRLDLLITNDTGPMHLAAAVDTPVLALFLASARVHDTGPVGEGHISLEPRLDCHPCMNFCARPQCYRVISPEAVAAWALRLMDAKPLPPVSEDRGWPDLRVYRATFDPLGYHTHVPLVRQPLDRRHFWIWLHRAAWGQLLDGHNGSLRGWLQNLLTRSYLPPRDDLGWAEGQRALEELVHLAHQGQAVAGQILALARNPAASPIRLWQKGEELRQIDPRLRRLAVKLPELASFIEFFFQQQRVDDNRDLLSLAREMSSIYRYLQSIGEICREEMGQLGRNFPGILYDINDINGMAQLVQNIPENSSSQNHLEVQPCR